MHKWIGHLRVMVVILSAIIQRKKKRIHLTQLQCPLQVTICACCGLIELFCIVPLFANWHLAGRDFIEIGKRYTFVLRCNCFILNGTIWSLSRDHKNHNYPKQKSTVRLKKVAFSDARSKVPITKWYDVPPNNWICEIIETICKTVCITGWPIVIGRQELH